jgi:hemerythrin-like domain-containing protein
MLVNIGHRQPATDLVSLLLECHDRIRTFGALAVTVGDQPGLPADQIDVACVRIARYFSESLPLHVQDEERSLLPRLGGRSAALDETLAAMQEQHRSHEAPLRQLIELCSSMRAAPDTAAKATFREVAHHLAREWRRHLELEETSLFPALGAALSPEEQTAIMVEMRARRQTP